MSNQRLVLRKQTIAIITPDEMNWVYGGDGTVPCPPPEEDTKTDIYVSITKASTYTCGTH